MKKSILVVFLVFIITIVPMLLVGCHIGKGKTDVPSIPDDSNVTDNGDGQDGQQLAEFAQLLDGFKVVYSKGLSGSTNPIQPLSDKLTTGILDQLNSFYGSGTDNDALASYFPDSIRQTICQDTDGTAQLADETSISNDQWLWTLNPKAKKNSAEIYDTIFQGQEYQTALANCQTTLNSTANNYPQLSNFYAIPLQISLFETLLGYDQTVFKVESGEKMTVVKNNISNELSSNYFIISIETCPNRPELNGKIIYKYVQGATSKIIINGEELVFEIKHEEIKINSTGEQQTADQEMIVNYLGDWEQKTGLMGEYQNKATYSGLTKTDADSLITYILNNVIGADVVKNDYVQFGPNQTTYRDSISLAKYETDGELDLAKLNYTDGTYNYYNYRNYVGRVAEMVDSLVYDGS